MQKASHVRWWCHLRDRIDRWLQADRFSERQLQPTHESISALVWQTAVSRIPAQRAKRLPMRVWTSFRVENDSSLSNAVNRTLADAGIESVSYRPGIAGPGLVFFDRVSEELCGLLREVTRAEAEPVLAVGAAHSAFNGENCWQLLNAGAANVFAWDHSEGPGAEIASRLKRWEKVDELMRSRLVQQTLIGHLQSSSD